MAELARVSLPESDVTDDPDLDLQVRSMQTAGDSSGGRGRQLATLGALAMLVGLLATAGLVSSLSAVGSSSTLRSGGEALSLQGSNATDFQDWASFLGGVNKSRATGCRNWASILLGEECGVQTLTLETCTSLCAGDSACKGFSIQTKECLIDGGDALDKGPCYLFKGSCESVESNCFDTYTMQGVLKECSSTVPPPCRCGSSVCRESSQHCDASTKTCTVASGKTTPTTTPGPTPEFATVAGCYIDVSGYNGGEVFQLSQTTSIATFTFEGTKRVATVTNDKVSVQGWAHGHRQDDGDILFEDGGEWTKVCCPGYGGDKTACEMCPAGKATNIEARKSICKSCGLGEFSETGSSSCKDCEEGKHSTEDFSMCIADGAPSPSSAPGGCCEMEFEAESFQKCDFWGDPHCTSSFGYGSFDMHGLGIFKVAASKDGEFEVQDVQCPTWNQWTLPKVALGIGVKMGSTKIVAHQNFVYVNGKKVTTSTANLLEGLKVTGDIMQDGVMIQSDDCCYRASIVTSKAPADYIAPFYHNVKIRVLDEKASDGGVCGAGPSYDTLVGSDDLLFDSVLLKDICSFCSEMPAQCTETVASPQPTPIPSAEEAAPEAMCEHGKSKGDCGGDPFAKARKACKALDGTVHKDGCMIDYCLAGCAQEMADSCLQERERVQTGSVTSFSMPEDDAPSIAVPTPASSASSCCGMEFNDESFKKCDFWGDPHCTSSFGHGAFDMHGLGIFKVAASKDGEFEVQDVQCPTWTEWPLPKVALGVGVKMGNTRIVAHQNFVYVNGKKVTSSTASLLKGLKVTGDLMQDGVVIQSDDCCYRADIKTIKAPADYTAAFYHNVKIRVLDDKASDGGVCGVGPSYDKLVGSDDLVFDDVLLKDICSFCSEKPAQCTETIASPQPTPIPSAEEAGPEAMCAHGKSKGECGEDPFAKAQEACKALDDTEHQNGCMIDYCLAGCAQAMADSCLQERERVQTGSITSFGFLEDDAPCIATVPTVMVCPDGYRQIGSVGGLFLGAGWGDNSTELALDCSHKCDQSSDCALFEFASNRQGKSFSTTCATFSSIDVKDAKDAETGHVGNSITCTKELPMTPATPAAGCEDSSGGARDPMDRCCDWYAENKEKCGTNNDLDFSSELMCCACRS